MVSKLKVMNYLFVITPFGLLRLIAPFRLVVITEDHPDLRKGDIIFAERVIYRREYRILFEVNLEWYEYHHFGLLL